MFRLVVDEVVPEGVMFFSPSENAITYMNRGASKYVGCAPEAATGLSLGRILVGTVDGRSWEDVVTEVREQGVFGGKVHIVTIGDVDDRVCTLSAFGVTDPARRDGELSEIVMLFRDVTEEENTAAQLEEKNIEMAKMNSELLRSNSELKRVSELKSNFLSIASHELKTPLTSIKGYSEIIIENMKERLDPAVFRMIESITRAADRLHRVINNMLDVTRIEQNRLRLSPERIDLVELANDCLQDLAQFSAQRGITFTCEFDEELPTFYGDKMRMHQVFTNLFSNAIKYSPDNSNVLVTIRIESEEGGFRIAVKDRGVGIDKQEQQNIFDPFYEVGKATRHSSDAGRFMGGGTGLGLSIVRGIVERHGGRIWVESEGMNTSTFPGSVFYITLPLEAKIHWDDDDTRKMHLPFAKEPMLEDEDVCLEDLDIKPRILLIDDDREAREITKVVLGSVFDIIATDCGEDGLNKAFTEDPSLVLLDLYLPGIDGVRVCKILRSQSETRDLPIAFFSAGTQNDEMQRCFAAGADDFIVKPFSGKELVDKVWRLLMKKKENLRFK